MMNQIEKEVNSIFRYIFITRLLLMPRRFLSAFILLIVAITSPLEFVLIFIILLAISEIYWLEVCQERLENAKERNIIISQNIEMYQLALINVKERDGLSGIDIEYQIEKEYFRLSDDQGNE